MLNTKQSKKHQDVRTEVKDEQTLRSSNTA